MAPALPLRRIAGRFYRAVLASHADDVLAPPGPQSAGRYHRPGQPALYLTPEADWAVIAVDKYLREDGLARVVVPVDLSAADVFDQHDVAACAVLGIDPELSNADWRAAMARGDEPSSWLAADAARAAGADGIVDRSRSIAGGWYVALFRWNAPGAPSIVVAGPAMAADYEAARSRWVSLAGMT